jgi:aminomethyltransferase
LATRLLAFDEVEWIGLGARDSLRLEAGLCLYGHDLGPDTTPVAANLNWGIQKSRRAGGDREGGFPGADIILSEMANGAARRRVGLLPEGKAPVREGAELVTAGGDVIGVVTSGGFGPSLLAPLAMGYLDSAYCGMETQVFALVRGKQLPCRVCKMPFVEQTYRR